MAIGLKRNYPALTGLRFFAAMAVVFFHYAAEVSGFSGIPGWTQRLIGCGPIALCFFYILSGFVLANSHKDRAAEKNNPEAKAFWLNRFARLYPVYFLAFMLFMPMAVQKYLIHPFPLSPQVAHKMFFAGAALSPLMLQAWTSFSQAWNGPSWSLSVEAFFYFIFPFVVLRITRANPDRTLPIIGFAWLLSVFLVIAKMTGLISKPFYLAYILYNPLFWTPLFLLGIEILRFVERWRSFRPVIANCVAFSLSFALIAICAVTPAKYDDLIVSVGLAPLLAVIILIYTNNNSWLARLFSCKPIYRLGEVSYITYILQSPLWHYFTAVVHGRPVGRSPQGISPVYFIFFLILLLGVSFGVSSYIEKPLYRWIMGKIKITDARKSSLAAQV